MLSCSPEKEVPHRSYRGTDNDYHESSPFSIGIHVKDQPSDIDEDVAPDTSIDEKVEAELDALGETNLLDETKPVE